MKQTTVLVNETELELLFHALAGAVDTAKKTALRAEVQAALPLLLKLTQAHRRLASYWSLFNDLPAWAEAEIIRRLTPAPAPAPKKKPAAARAVQITPAGVAKVEAEAQAAARRRAVARKGGLARAAKAKATAAGVAP